MCYARWWWKEKPCGGYDKSLKLKDVILVTGSVSKSNYGNELDGYKKDVVAANNILNLVIESTAINKKLKIVKGNIYCTDAFYENDYDYKERCKDKDVLGVYWARNF